MCYTSVADIQSCLRLLKSDSGGEFATSRSVLSSYLYITHSPTIGSLNLGTWEFNLPFTYSTFTLQNKDRLYLEATEFLPSLYSDPDLSSDTAIN